MYQILLVDDETIALEALKTGVDWKKHGITRVFATCDAENAKQIISSEQIDFAICDIEMPNETGFDLVRWINTCSPATLCIFLTCHSEFQYAKQAIQLGALDYILKPVDYDELTEVLQKAIHRKKEMMQTQYAKSVISDIQKDIVERSQEPEHTAQFISDAKAYILENIGNENLDVRSVATHVCLHPDYLSRLFKSETNMSVKNYIIQTRISVACSLLTDTNLSISKIATSCGYFHMAHFSSIFKQKTGLTPNKYRTKYQNKNV